MDGCGKGKRMREGERDMAGLAEHLPLKGAKKRVGLRAVSVDSAYRERVLRA